MTLRGFYFSRVRSRQRKELSTRWGINFAVRWLEIVLENCHRQGAFFPLCCSKYCPDLLCFSLICVNFRNSRFPNWQQLLVKTRNKMIRSFLTGSFDMYEASPIFKFKRYTYFCTIKFSWIYKKKCLPSTLLQPWPLTKREVATNL